MPSCSCTDACSQHPCPTDTRKAQVERELARLKAIEEGTLMDEPEERECRECGQPFFTKVARRGSKWGAMCSSCLQYEI